MKPTKAFFDFVKAYNDGFTLIGLKGSARSGKTVGIVQGLDFFLNFSKKHRKASIISQTYPHLRDGAINEYKRHQMREGVVRQHNKSDHEFTVNNSIINYFAVDDPTKAIGPGREIAYFNELNNGISFDTFNHVQARTSEFVVFDYNPAGEFFLHDHKLMEQEGSILLHSTWLDNLENLTKKQIADFIRAKTLSKKFDYWRYWWEVYGEGKDAVLLDERIMPILKRASKVPAGAVQIPSALDFGFYPDPTAFCELFVVPGELRDKLYIKERVYDTKLSINSRSATFGNLVDRLATKEVNKKHQIIAECADPKAISEMRTAGFNIEAVVKSTVETSIRLFHDYDIYIVDGSDNAWKEMDNYKYKRNRKGVILGIPADGQPDHIIDGIRYVLSSRGSRWQIKINK